MEDTRKGKGRILMNIILRKRLDIFLEKEKREIRSLLYEFECINLKFWWVGTPSYIRSLKIVTMWKGFRMTWDCGGLASAGWKLLHTTFSLDRLSLLYQLKCLDMLVDMLLYILL